MSCWVHGAAVTRATGSEPGGQMRLVLLLTLGSREFAAAAAAAACYLKAHPHLLEAKRVLLEWRIHTKQVGFLYSAVQPKPLLLLVVLKSSWNWKCRLLSFVTSTDEGCNHGHRQRRNGWPQPQPHWTQPYPLLINIEATTGFNNNTWIFIINSLLHLVYI